jgi:hypothetical protein
VQNKKRLKEVFLWQPASTAFLEDERDSRATGMREFPTIGDLFTTGSFLITKVVKILGYFFHCKSYVGKNCPGGLIYTVVSSPPATEETGAVYGS